MPTFTRFLCFVLTMAATSVVHAQAPPDAPRIPPTTVLGGPAIWPPYEKIEAVLKHWAAEHPVGFQLEELGKSVEGRSIYAVTMMDPNLPDENKQHALVTALHAGNERGAATTVMGIIEWFLSSDPRVGEILRNQVVLFLVHPIKAYFVS